MMDFDDIIDMPHHISKRYPQMSMHDRAAQFSPFAALVGYESAVRETARLTDQKNELGEYEAELLNKRLGIISELSDIHPMINITYFRPDELKSGGAYVTERGSVKCINEYDHTVVLVDGRKISINDIACIEGEIFDMSDSFCE